MQSEEIHVDAAASRAAPDGAISERTRLSRRQAIGRMSAIASAGAAAWVVPEILTAKPAGGATLSAPAVVTGASTAPATATATIGPTTAPGANPATTPPTSLAYTGLNIQRDAEIGAALVAGGWAMHHWASRTPTPEAESPGAPA